MAIPNDDDAIKEAFYRLPGFKFQDRENTKWSVAEGDTAMRAGWASPLMEGTIDNHGILAFSPEQRVAIYEAWKKNPKNLWLLNLGLSCNFVPQKIQDHYEITLESDMDRTMREEDEKRLLATQTPLSSSVYTQTGFPRAQFVKDFDEWRIRFRKDIDAFDIKMGRDYDYGQRLLKSQNTDELALTFNHSIDGGPKGLYLRKVLIAAYYARGGGEGTEVDSPGNIVTKLIFLKDTTPVGYGGTFLDQGTQVELWYMVFDNMASWSMQDFNQSLIFKAFKPIDLPPFKAIKRNSWPALVFTRDSNGKIKLFAMSLEMEVIIGSIINAQLY
jgi:hypothetical protein